jgi:hypothetical protein
MFIRLNGIDCPYQTGPFALFWANPGASAGNALVSGVLHRGKRVRDRKPYRTAYNRRLHDARPRRE